MIALLHCAEKIDRDAGTLKAHGHVLSQLLDKPKKADDPETAGTAVDPPARKDSKKPPAPPVFTIVKAPDLDYNDDNRPGWPRTQEASC